MEGTYWQSISSSVSMILAMFRWVKPLLPTYARIRFVQAFIFPHLDYCSCVWDSANLEKLFKLQKWAARLIYDLPTHTPTVPLLFKLNWMIIMDWVKYRKAIMVYKSLNGLAPPYMRKMFKFFSYVSKWNTRYVDKTRLYLPKGKHLKRFTDSFAYSAADVWNTIPNNIRNCETIGAFKHAYLKWCSHNQ